MPNAAAQRSRRHLAMLWAVAAPAVPLGCSNTAITSEAPDADAPQDAASPTQDATVAMLDSGPATTDSGSAPVDSGNPVPPDDAAALAADDSASALDAGGGGFPDASTFVCNLFIGVSVTGDWFAAGFEDGLDGDHWEAKWQSLAFVEQWADPANAVWSQALTSACPVGADAPGRVIFTGVNWTFTTEAEWETQLTAVVETLKTKYAGLEEVDLMTMLRAPGNVVCGNPGSPEQVVQPFIDEAIQAVVAKYPSFVRAAPAFYAPSCDVFLPNSPHFADGGAARVAKVMRDYYATH